MLRKTKMRAHGKVDRQNEVSRIAGRVADPVRKAHLCFGKKLHIFFKTIIKYAVIRGYGVWGQSPQRGFWGRSP